MRLLERVKAVVPVLDDERLHECRACGTTLRNGVQKCPECGSEEIAVFEL